MNRNILDRALSGYIGLSLLGILCVLLVLLPVLMAADSFYLHLAFITLVFATMGHAWNLMAGYAGLLSFGNQVFIGIGGFAVAIFYFYFKVNIWVSLPLGGLVSALFAWLLTIPLNVKWQGKAIWKPVAIAVLLWIIYEIAIAYNPKLDVFGNDFVRRIAILLLIFLGALPLLNLEGAYFAVATWLIAAAVGTIFNEWKVVGAGGGMQIKTDATLPEMYYAALLLLAVSTLVIWRLLRSRYGLALTAVRDDGEAAQTSGIDIGRVKMLVFVLSGAMTGVAAGLFYMNIVIITPPAAFTVFWSAYFVFIVVAGGIGTLAGPFIGAIFFVLIDRVLANILDQGLLLLGAISVLIILFMPSGFMGIIAFLRAPESNESRNRRDMAIRLMRLIAGSSGRSSISQAKRPGVVGAFLVSGSPLPLMRPEAAHWKEIDAGYRKAREALAELQPDVILIYSTQWMAVLDQLWQTRPRVTGLHVDENWHDFGTLRFDFRVDASLANACIRACNDNGIRSKAVDYDGFPIDTGTIVANAYLNPYGDIPVVVAANNLYYDLEKTRRLGEISVAEAVQQGKRVVVVAVGGLSQTFHKGEIDPEQDAIASEADDAWNRRILSLIEQGDFEEVQAEIELYAKEAKVDMGFKHFAWLSGCVGNRAKGGRVLAYAPVYGTGQTILQLDL